MPIQTGENQKTGKELLQLISDLLEDSNPPEISAELLNDTGVDDTDNITSDPTIIGNINTENEIVSLTAGFNDTSVEQLLM